MKGKSMRGGERTAGVPRPQRLLYTWGRRAFAGSPKGAAAAAGDPDSSGSADAFERMDRTGDASLQQRARPGGSRRKLEHPYAAGARHGHLRQLAFGEESPRLVHRHD